MKGKKRVTTSGSDCLNKGLNMDVLVFVYRCLNKGAGGRCVTAIGVSVKA